MNKKLLIPVFVLLSACAIITEPDISNSDVFLVAPVDNLTTEVSFQTFWWDRVPDAERYNVIIVSPRWDSIVSLIADTNVTDNKFMLSLPAGEYDWAVSAFNYSSATQYYIRHITINPTQDLTNQKVKLVSPQNDDYSNLQETKLTWEKISYANKYHISVKHNDWNGELAVPSETTSENSFSFTLDEGVYAWGVKAENDESITNSASIRTITIDRTAPGIPEYTKPQYNGDTISSVDPKIVWSHPVSSLAPITDSILISKDSAAFSQNLKELKVLSTNQYKLQEYSSGFYYVQVRSFDAAGNIGQSTSITKFYFDAK
jgi:hypothetical protein